MSSIQSASTATPVNAHPGPSGVWQSIKHLWCRHTTTLITPKTDTMPAHVVCQSCGWREPVLASAPPQGTRTWDSSRDEARYQIEKKRREAVEEQRQMVMARLATPTPRRARRSRTSDNNLLHMKRAIGE
jgi:hypothetical protein